MVHIPEAAQEKTHITYADWFSFPRLLEVDQMLDLQIIYSPTYLIEIIETAKQYYESKEGEYKEFRLANSELWLGNILKFLHERRKQLDTVYPLVYTPNILDYHKVSIALKNHYDFKVNRIARFPAIWFAGGCELTLNHFSVLDYIFKTKRFLPIIWLENDSYISSKERGGPFFPREVTLSVLSHYIAHQFGNRGVITFNPQSLGINGIDTIDLQSGERGKLDIEPILRNLVKDLNLYGVFRNIGSPAYLSQFNRTDIGLFCEELEIPHFGYPSTTELVRI